jgi:putative endonuclease
MNYFSYILFRKKDKRYYYGSTNNIVNRLKRHNKGEVKSTKNRIPLTLHFSESFSNRSEAYKREQFYKSIDGYNWLKQNKII